MAKEGFEFEFKRRGVTLPVTACSGEGVELAGERDAWPAGVGLKLEPVSEFARIRCDQIRRNNGWKVFKLNVSQAGTRLRFEGVKPGLLPEGQYRASIYIGGYRFHNATYDIDVPKNGTAVVKAEERADPRVAALERPVENFDPELRRIVEASFIDGRGLARWLEDPNQRDARKACLLNVLARLRTPVEGNEPLAARVRSVFLADVDRVYAKLDGGFAEMLSQFGSGFRQDPGPIHETHGRLRLRFPKGTTHELRSFREMTAERSLQIVTASTNDIEAPQYADVDIDLGNPFVNPKGFVIHLGELIDPDRTDHLALCASLTSSPSGEFLYYRVAEAAAESGPQLAATGQPPEVRGQGAGSPD
jgi:hypothetical protein